MKLNANLLSYGLFAFNFCGALATTLPVFDNRFSWTTYEVGGFGQVLRTYVHRIQRSSCARRQTQSFYGLKGSCTLLYPLITSSQHRRPCMRVLRESF